MDRYDIAIIGTGPGGFEAAITAKVRNKNIILFGSSEVSPKVKKAHQVDNYLGLPEVSGEDMGQTFLNHVKQMGIPITEEKVSMVMPMGDYFMIQSANDMYEATTVILAAGMSAGKTFPGEEQFLGRGVSYCATCDAALYKGKKAAIFGFSPEEEAEADFMAEYADEVLYFPQYKEEVHVKDGIWVIHEKPVSVEGEMKVSSVTTDGNTYEVDGVFFLRPSISPGQLLPGLETEGQHVKVDRSMATNVSGCYACGDITGLPYQFIKAAGEGNVAALSAVSYIDQMRRTAKE